jgi:hypothetical protein
MQIIVVQSGLCALCTARSIAAATCTCSHALKADWIYGHCYACTHACAITQLNYIANERRTPRHQEKGAQHTTAAGHTKKLLLCYCRTQETPGAPGDVRGGQERHQRDRGAQRGNRERHQEDRMEQRGGRSGPQGQRDPKRARFFSCSTVACVHVGPS